jgi:hypothetical protein
MAQARNYPRGHDLYHGRMHIAYFDSFIGDTNLALRSTPGFSLPKELEDQLESIKKLLHDVREADLSWVELLTEATKGGFDWVEPLTEANKEGDDWVEMLMEADKELAKRQVSYDAMVAQTERVIHNIEEWSVGEKGKDECDERKRQLLLDQLNILRLWVKCLGQSLDLCPVEPFVIKDPLDTGQSW